MWTPVIGTIGSLSLNPSFTAGRWIKHGNLVSIHCRIYVASSTISGENIVVQGIPSFGAALGVQCPITCYWDQFKATMAGKTMIGFINDSEDPIKLRIFAMAGSAEEEVGSKLQTNSQFLLSATFRLG